MILTKSKIFQLCCIAFIVAIGIASFLPINIVDKEIQWFSAVIVSVLVAFAFWDKKRIRIIALIGLFLFLGVWRYGVGIVENEPGHIRYYNGTEVVFEGNILKEPDVRVDNTKLKIEVTDVLKVDGVGMDNDVEGNVLVTVDLYPEYKHGDELLFRCQLKQPEVFLDFHYDSYLARHDIYSLCYYPKVELLKSEETGFHHYIYKKKQEIRDIIGKGLKEPEAGLVKAIILGYKKDIDEDIRLKFNEVGIGHVAAISGLHIGVLAAIILNLLLLLGFNRRKVFYISTFILVGYIIAIGAPASAVRAGIMGFMALLAVYNGRMRSSINVLVFAAVIMLLFNPRLFRDDIGFQLSFLAVLGIVVFYPIFDKLVTNFKKRKGKIVKIIVDTLNISISVQIFTVPIVGYVFKQIPLVSLLANILVIWLLPVLIVSSILAIVFSLLLPTLSAVFFFPSYIILKYIVGVAELLSRIPFASIYF